MVMALSGHLTYLERVVMEIVDTERSYVRDLRMVVEDYLSTIIEQVCVRPELVCSLFGNIEDIYEFNSELLQDLDLCDRDPVGVARCFVMKSQYFHIYSQYCTNYPNSVEALTECMRNKTLAKFLRDRQASLSRSLPLGSYLLKPVQRILKYHLLLQEISKHFDPQQEGFEVVEEALGTMTGVAWYINDMKRKHEHAVRLQEVQSLLLGWKGSELSAYGELLLEGTFRVHRTKQRTLFLLDRLLLISKHRGEHYVYKTHLSSSSLMLMQSSKDSLSFSIAHYKHPKQAHTVQAKSVEEKNLWTHHIKRIIVENHHAIIPQRAKEAILEMDSVYNLRYRYSPERTKKSPPPLNRKIESTNLISKTSKADRAALSRGTFCMQEAETGSEHHPEGAEPQSAEQEAKPAEPHGPPEDQDLEQEPAVDSKVLSSAESSEDEDGDGRNSSILPSSVLNRAGDIALHGSARRRGSALEGSIKQGGVASEGRLRRGGAASDGSPVCASPQLPSMLSATDSANQTPRLRRRSLVSVPPWPPLSPPQCQSGRRGRGFTLSERDQLLIGRIKAYYENAANQDEAFTLQRRESLTFIPNGLVRDSVSRFSRTRVLEPSEGPSTEPQPEQNLESSSEEVFRPSSEVMKIWQQMEVREQNKNSTVSLNQNHQDRTKERTTERTTDRTTGTVTDRTTERITERTTGTTSNRGTDRTTHGTKERTTDRTSNGTTNRTRDRISSQRGKDSSGSREDHEVLRSPGPLVQLGAEADVDCTKRSVLSLARRFSQRIRTYNPQSQQNLTSVQEEGSGTVQISIPECTGGDPRSHTPPSVEVFDWPDVRELRSRYDEHRNPGLGLRGGAKQAPFDLRPSSSEEALPTSLLHPCCSDPDLFGPDNNGSVGPDLSCELQENFSGFRVSAETPLLNDPSHRILVLEKLPEISEDPQAAEEDSYVQIRSPTSREKISFMAVMERCRVYEDSEENRHREHSVVRNLREKFQSLS